MAADDKTEEPSQRRLDEARKKGQIPKSQELNSVVLLFVAFYALRSFSTTLYYAFAEEMRHGLSRVGHMQFAPGNVLHLGIGLVLWMTRLLLPVVGFIFLAAIVVNVLQVGILFSGQGLMPNFSKLNPGPGFQRMFSRQSLVQLLKSVAEIFVVLFTLKEVIQTRGLVIFQMAHMDAMMSLTTLASLTWDVAYRIVMVLLVIALLDYAFQRWQHHQNLRMSKQEVKDEYKQQEGDPHIKGRIRAKQREMARKRMMAAVPQAHVVVTNPLHLAVALQYDFETMETPLVVAKGKGFVADRIRELARAHDIPVIENREVARALYDNVEVDGEIPSSMFQAVAEIIAYLYQKRYAHLIPNFAPAAAPVAAPPPPPRLGGAADRLELAAGLAARDVRRGGTGSRDGAAEEDSSAPQERPP